MMRFYQLLFQDLRFREGFNTTLRLGDKHYYNILKQITDDNPNVMLKLTESTNPLNFRLARLIHVESLYWSQITNIECASNHVARSKTALKNAMMDAYAKDIKGYDILTIIAFDMLPKDNDGGKDIINIPPTPSLMKS